MQVGDIVFMSSASTRMARELCIVREVGLVSPQRHELINVDNGRHVELVRRDHANVVGRLLPQYLNSTK